MLSRVADSIYWTSRYIERAENVARFLDVNLLMMLEASTLGISNQWEPVVAATGDMQIFKSRYGKATQQSVIRFLATDAQNPNSILSCVRNARENARTIREVISSEMWERINGMYHLVSSAMAGDTGVLATPHEFFTEVKFASHLFEGVTDATMSHNEAWQFAKVGRLLERADKTSRIVDVKYFILLPKPDDVGTPLDTLQWQALLRSASALEMYRKRFQRIAPIRVAQFLILDHQFPRAIHYCLLGAEDALHAISGAPDDTFSNRAEQRLGRLRADFSYTSIDEIVSFGLHEYLDQFQTRLNSVGEAIYENFFAPATSYVVQPAGRA